MPRTVFMTARMQRYMITPVTLVKTGYVTRCFIEPTSHAERIVVHSIQIPGVHLYLLLLPLPVGGMPVINQSDLILTDRGTFAVSYLGSPATIEVCQSAYCYWISDANGVAQSFPTNATVSTQRQVGAVFNTILSHVRVTMLQPQSTVASGLGEPIMTQVLFPPDIDVYDNDTVIVEHLDNHTGVLRNASYTIQHVLPVPGNIAYTVATFEGWVQ